jgi:prepilin-type N-terminal cleavage/methylation domain-containing protein
MSRLPQRGFTLIEIIVSVTLVLILMGLSIAGYNGFTSTQTLSQGSATVKNDLRAVRTSATSGLKPDGCDTLVGYTVTFPGATSYTSTAACDMGGSRENVGPVVTYVLPKGVTFSPVPQPITFYAVSQGTTDPKTVTLVNQGKMVTINVTSAGMVDFIPTPTP